MSLIGREVNDFKVKAFHNGEFKDVSKADILGKWSVFVFYPADFTFVCPTELSDLADLYEEFQKAGTEIYSVSTDSHFVHKAWHDASDTIKRIQYPMLADPTGKLCRDFGVYIEDEGMALRGSFIVNPQGRIVSYEINDNSIGRDASELLRKVQAAQYVAKHGDQVCPAKWRPGAETLTPGIELVGRL
ncbi:MAG: alkyl hydroperoxide reductase subunit C [Limnochordia bacterium]